VSVIIRLDREHVLACGRAAAVLRRLDELFEAGLSIDGISVSSVVDDLDEIGERVRAVAQGELLRNRRRPSLRSVPGESA